MNSNLLVHQGIYVATLGHDTSSAAAGVAARAGAVYSSEVSEIRPSLDDAPHVGVLIPTCHSLWVRLLLRSAMSTVRGGNGATAVQRTRHYNDLDVLQLELQPNKLNIHFHNKRNSGAENEPDAALVLQCSGLEWDSRLFITAGLKMPAS